MPQRTASARRDSVAVIDIGSNSGRVMVFQRDASSHLRLLAGSRASLRLVHDVDTRRQLTEGTMSRTLEALRDFQAIAASAGATRLVAVATAAMRDASNAALFTERVRRELGIDIDIIGGLKEARYGFAGAVRGVAASSGLLFDLGGGSVQVTRFTERRMDSAVSLPFGALRVSEKFLDADPPTKKQIRRLRQLVLASLKKARIDRLPPGHVLVGTGGTVRNLAKIDRETRQYPIRSLHGYELPVDRLAEVVDRLASTRRKHRDDISGLSAERADSIVGGAIVIHTLAEFVRADSILVSGKGVREGVAQGLLKLTMGSPDAVKTASLESLVSRFDGWRPAAAARRREVAATLQRALEPRAPASVASAIDRAALVLDIGRSLDVVDRHEHVADILLTTDLAGFSHEDLALMSAIVKRAGDRHADVMSMTLVPGALDVELLDRAAIVLSLADEIEARCPRDRRITIDCEIGRRVILTVPALPSWLAKDLDSRFERAFGRALIVRHRSPAD
jgi:exopolyphosphatase/guanosine-5'-triphosphate,3'-diphosphate pyrophosphatase